jgi:transposase-like protein
MEWCKKTWQGIKTLLITDGAPAYPKVARECQIDHDCVNHSKGQFAKWIKRRQQRINSNTGMIDQCWKELKNIPSGLTTQSPWLLVYARCWQWRYINMCKDILKTTAKAVQQALLG